MLEVKGDHTYSSASHLMGEDKNKRNTSTVIKGIRRVKELKRVRYRKNSQKPSSVNNVESNYVSNQQQDVELNSTNCLRFKR